MSRTYEFVPSSGNGPTFTVTFDEDLVPTAIDGEFLSDDWKASILDAALLHPMIWWQYGYGVHYAINEVGGEPAS